MTTTMTTTVQKFVRRWIFPVWCIGCGEPDVGLCAGCAPAPSDATTLVIANTGVTATGSYDGVLRRAIIAMKRGERAYLEPFAELCARSLSAGVPLIPLPTTRRRRAGRGFDQAVELARRTARLRGVPCCEVLEKRGAAQRGLNRFARLHAQGRFRTIPGATLPAAALVIDDVCTTGATLADAIMTLRAAGVAVFGALVLARAEPDRNSPGPATVLAHGSPSH